MRNDDARLIAEFARRQMQTAGSGRGGEPGSKIENVNFNVTTNDPVTAAMRMRRQLRNVVNGVRVR
jgi:hypothetical protein